MMDPEARLVGELGRRLADGKLVMQLGWRDDVVNGLDAQVFGFEIHGIVAVRVPLRAHPGPFLSFVIF